MTRYMIEVRDRRPLAVGEGELLTLSAAAERVGISVQALSGAIDRGEMRRIIDTQEPNPTKASRVLVGEVEAARLRRRRRPSRVGRLPKPKAGKRGEKG